MYKNKHNTLTASKHFPLILCLGLVDPSILRVWQFPFSGMLLLYRIMHVLQTQWRLQWNHDVAVSTLKFTTIPKPCGKSPHVCEPASVQRQPVMSCKAGCSRSDLGKGNGVCQCFVTYSNYSSIFVCACYQPHLHFLHFLGPSLLPPCFYSSDLTGACNSSVPKTRWSSSRTRRVPSFVSAFHIFHEPASTR